VLSERDLQGLEFLLARAHQHVRELRKNAPGPQDSQDGPPRRGRE
jgi:hypothetical protein